MLRLGKYQTISITKARNLYNAGHKVGIVGNNVNEYHFFGGWHLATWISLADAIAKGYGSLDGCVQFDARVANFKFYLEPELGRRVRFFVQVED